MENYFKQLSAEQQVKLKSKFPKAQKKGFNTFRRTDKNGDISYTQIPTKLGKPANSGAFKFEAVSGNLDAELEAVARLIYGTPNEALHRQSLELKKMQDELEALKAKTAEAEHEELPVNPKPSPKKSKPEPKKTVDVPPIAEPNKTVEVPPVAEPEKSDIYVQD